MRKKRIIKAFLLINLQDKNFAIAINLNICFIKKKGINDFQNISKKLQLYSLQTKIGTNKSFKSLLG